LPVGSTEAQTGKRGGRYDKVREQDVAADLVTRALGCVVVGGG